MNVNDNNYVVYHLHSDLSNPTTSMSVDSTTKFYQYLDLAQQQGMTSFCFSEHGSVMNWIKKKQEVEKRGMKYIHANEIYLTEHTDKERKLIRDNYHYMLIARNLDGVHELNKLTSISNNKEDGHFYYNPRLSFDDLFNTTDNIIMTSACLASPLWRAIKNNNKEMMDKLLDFFIKNKHRMFLEIQYHSHPEQKLFNQHLYDIHKQTGIPLIAGTDTHSLNREHAQARNILMKAKKATYGDEDAFDLTFKSFEELKNMFKEQNAIPRDAYMEAIYNTNVMAGMVEEFEIDESPKYPQLYNEPEKVFKEKINEGIKIRGIDKFPKDKKEQYFQRVRDEFDTYKKVGAINYMLLQKNIIDWCHENDIYQGYGRGSVNGSLIAYVIGITEMDSIKHDLNFFRFLNPERISLADIDVDFPPSRRQDVIDYVSTLPNIYFSEIVTFNTVALKGAIREVGRALQMDLEVVDVISKSVYKDDEKHDAIPSHFREDYPELFKYVDLINGVIVSIGSHPSGYIVSPVDLEKSIGLCYTKDSEYPVSQVNMKELDGCNFVKLDILGLDNIEIINETCKLAKIERLTPDNIDDKDIEVWKSIRESGLGIFQWEGDGAQRYLKELLSDETIEKIKARNSNFKFIDLFSIGNGAIRPSGDSYRNDLASGVFKDSGHDALNEFLKDTMGYLVYQEQIMNWLVQFCNYSMAMSDTVRRGMSKKEGTEKFLPQITSEFIKTMKEKYNDENAINILDPFLKVIDDAQRYGFSVNHSQPYSLIGYANGYLRYYYPLEFLTVMLNIADKQEKIAKIVEYANSVGIHVKPIKFGKSKSAYELSKEDNSIYKGIKSIKFLNEKIADELMELSKNTYDDFISLLIDITEKTSVNTRQLDILIKLDFFSQYGGNNELLKIYELFSSGEFQYKKTYVEKTKIKRIEVLKEKELEIRNILPDKEKKIKPPENVMFEKDVLGYSEVKYPNMKENYVVVLDIDTKYTPKLNVYELRTGEEKIYKMKKKNFNTNNESTQIVVGDLILINSFDLEPRKKLVDGVWTELEDKEAKITSYTRYINKK